MAYCTYRMLDEGHRLLGILEAPLANVKPLDSTAHEFFRVKRRVPGWEQDVAQHDIVHVAVCLDF